MNDRIITNTTIRLAVKLKTVYFMFFFDFLVKTGGLLGEEEEEEEEEGEEPTSTARDPRLSSRSLVAVTTCRTAMGSDLTSRCKQRKMKREEVSTRGSKTCILKAPQT